MTKYDKMVTVGMTTRDWLSLTIAMYDAVDHMIERKHTVTAQNYKRILDYIRFCTEEHISEANRETEEYLQENIIQPPPNPVDTEVHF